MSAESLDQLELARATVADTAPRVAKSTPRRRARPGHLPREKTVLHPEEHRADCGGALKRLGEDVTEELEYVPARFIVRRLVRPRLTCTRCERFHQAPLPARAIDRGRPGPGLLVHVLVSKYCDHLPLYRQSRIFAREGVELERSTLAGWVGKTTALLEPLADAVGRHVRAGRCLFADDTPVKVLAPGAGKSATARAWVYVRDERPWCGEGPPAAWYRFSPDRKAHHPQGHLAYFRGSMHADGYAGFERLIRAGPIREVTCLAHVRHKFFDVHAYPAKSGPHDYPRAMLNANLEPRCLSPASVRTPASSLALLFVAGLFAFALAQGSAAEMYHGTPVTPERCLLAL